MLKNRITKPKTSMRVVGRILLFSYVFLFFLFTQQAHAATGDISSITASSTGKQITFEVEGLDGSLVTQIESGGSITLDITSEGYSSKVLGTKLRTSIRTNFATSTASSTNAFITLNLEEPIYNDDTSITLTASSGAFDDGSNTSNATSSVSLANSSTKDYPIPTAVVVSEVLTRETGQFYVDVYAAGAAAKGHRAQFGIDTVEVTITDNASGTGTAVTKATTTMQLIDRIGSDGHRPQWQAFRVGPFNVDVGGDWSGGATKDLATVVAKAYPKIGDTNSIRTDSTRYIYLDPADSYDVQEVWVSTTGDDGTGIANNSSLPFATIHKAIKAAQDASSESKASFSTVYLEEGDHELGTYSFGDKSNTGDGPVTITRASGAAKANTRITGSADSSGVRTLALKLEDLTITAATGISPIQTGSPADGTSGPLGSDNYLILREVDMNGPGSSVVMGTGFFSSFENIQRLGCTVDNAWTGDEGYLARDCSFTRISGDGPVPGSNAAIINNYYDIDAGATAQHADVLQFANGVTYSNFVFHNNFAKSSGEVQMAPFVNGSTGGAQSTQLISTAFTFNLQEADAKATLSQVDDVLLKGVYFYHNDWADSFSFREDDDELEFDDIWWLRNFNNSLGTSGAVTEENTGFIGNHNASGVYSAGFDWTTGGTVLTQFVDWANADYRPAQSGNLVSVWSDPIAPYDAYGVLMPTDGTGAIGALQTEYTAPTITSASSDKANGSYTTGEVIDIDVTFSEAVTSTGNVTITLETGDTDRTCTFTISSSSTGTCNYTVQAGDISSDLTVQSISGTISDTAGNAMSNFVPTTNLAATSALVIDTTTQVLFSGSPSGEQSSGTTSVTLSLATDEDAFCKYGTTANTVYASIANSFSATSTSHSVSVSGLSDGSSYTYYIRCQDATGNTNSSDFTISFSVASAAEESPSTTQSGGRTPPSPTVPSGGFTATAESLYPNKTNKIHFAFGNDITKIVISENKNFSSALYINATSSFEWTEADKGIIYVKYCNKYQSCSDTISVNIDITPNVSTKDTTHIAFTAILGLDMVHVDIKKLQEFLNTDPDTRLAESGVGSLKNETEYFGYLTENAVKRFQAKHNIVSLGSPETTGYGLVGPRTMLKLNELFGDSKITVTEGQPQTQKLFAYNLSWGDIKEDVRRLQQYLNSNGFVLADSGPGSLNNETDRFGTLTYLALIAFQNTHAEEILIPVGITQGTGYLGSSTRAFINLDY